MLSSILSKLSPSGLKNSFFSSPEESPSTGQPKDSPVPKFSFAERIREDNTAKNLIIWHDPNVNNKENIVYCDVLRDICEYKTFEDWEEAAKEIKQSSIQCHVLTSGTNGKELVEQISSLRHVAAVYVFCKSVEYHSQWAKRFSKVNLVDNDIENILDKMKVNMQKLFRQKSLLRASFPRFIFEDDDGEKVENFLNLYIQGFTNPSNRNESEEEFLALAQQVDINVSFCEEFKDSYKQYDRKVILQKYNEELYKIVNSCLRIGTPEAVQPCQYILKDLELAIRDDNQLAETNYSGLVYKGVYLSSDEWQEFKDNIGKNIELYGFLFADKIEPGCDAFVKADNFYRAKITIIVLNGVGKSRQGGFADMKEYSWMENEDEILFNVRSRFKVLNAEMLDIDGVKCRHLFLLYIGGEDDMVESHPKTVEVQFDDILECDYCDTLIHMTQEDSLCYISLNDSKRLCAPCKVKGEHNKHPLFLVYKSQLTFLEKNQKEAGCLRIEGAIPENPQMMNVPFYGYECSECKATQLVKCYKCTVCQQPSRKWCGKCIAQKQDCIRRMHLIVLEENPYTFLIEKIPKKFAYDMSETAIKFYNDLKERTSDDQDLIVAANESLGDIYQSLGKDEEAIQSYREVVSASKNDQRKSAEVESKLAKIYTKSGRNQDALERLISAHGKSMFAFKEVKGQHYTVAAIKEEMGDTYCNLGEKEVGEKFYGEALKIMQDLLSPKHKKFIDLYIKLGKLSLGEGAIQYYEKAIEIQQYIFGDMDDRLVPMFDELGSIFTSMGRFKNALGAHQKALRIENSKKDKPMTMGNLYEKIGSMYYKLNNLKKAKESYENAFEQRLVFDQQLDAAKSYSILGEICQGLGDSEKAKEYLMNALKVRESLLGVDHLETAGSYFDLGEFYDALGDQENSVEYCKKSLEYHEKALEIRQSLLDGENHAEVATSYGVLAKLHFNLNQHEQSEKENWKALEIFQKIHGGEEHSNVALIYSNLAALYDTLKKPQLAKEYFMKAAEIWSKVCGEKDPMTTAAYQNLIAVLEDLGDSETAESYRILINNS